jgi:hypothetical protein
MIVYQKIAGYFHSIQENSTVYNKLTEPRTVAMLKPFCKNIG